ncbi:unnamed protein product [Trifolium pratense]|uniref:Uncharacterized protein n=1 Tax=Trifolium pratense TaxID=57577 RepID=A0ACB0LAK0_TRIPR|nr:unnamed protein product [Trifolium pratense]
MRLQERRVPCQLICPLCNQHNEDDWHVFLGCEVSIQDRQVAGLTQAIASRLVQTCDIAHVILDICSTETKEIAGTAKSGSNRTTSAGYTLAKTTARMVQVQCRCSVSQRAKYDQFWLVSSRRCGEIYQGRDSMDDPLLKENP